MHIISRSSNFENFCVNFNLRKMLPELKSKRSILVLTTLLFTCISFLAKSQCDVTITPQSSTTFCAGDSVTLVAYANGDSMVLDQSQTLYDGGTSARNLPGYSYWQSFEAGITGTLVQIEVGHDFGPLGLARRDAGRSHGSDPAFRRGLRLRHGLLHRGDNLAAAELAGRGGNRRTHPGLGGNGLGRHRAGEGQRQRGYEHE